MIVCYLLYSQEQQYTRENERLQQQLQQAQEAAGMMGLQVFTFQTVQKILVKSLSKQSGASEEAIMSSVAQQTEQEMKAAGQGQVLGALEAAVSKSSKNMT